LPEADKVLGGQSVESEILSEAEAAELLGVEVTTLANWRWRRMGPRFVKVGRRVRYRRADVDAWFADQVRDPARS
jgi:excisionase family DNA binding protein